MGPGVRRTQIGVPAMTPSSGARRTPARSANSGPWTSRTRIRARAGPAFFGYDATRPAASLPVLDVGTATRAQAQQSVLTAVASVAAATQQQSAAGVSLDEKNVALIAHQHAYQGAPRVMTAIDEMLDTLIDRTGVVGH
ncbi:MAG: flagellar basal body rod C-terminal domain-containing protein [Arthrobacter sp.]|uniref:flagellar basal body rod C-terminal domain-containing protein n=1 Tax=Arthrobacter sp. TaxID=1667 RepID=UPI003474259E